MTEINNMEEFSFEILILRWYRFLKGNLLSILLFTITFLGLAVLYNSTKTKLFFSNAVIYSNIAHEERISLIIEDLSLLAEKGNFNTLAKYLDISPEDAMAIKKIEVEMIEVNTVNNKSEGIFNNFDEHCLSINVKVTDPSIIEQIERGIKSYLMDNDFLGKLNTSRKKSLNTIIQKIDEQIGSLEHYQKSSLANLEEVNKALVINSEVNSTSMDLIYLLERKENYIEMLTLDEVEYVKPFIIPEKPDSKLVIYIGVGLISGLIVGLLFATIRKLNSKI